MDQEVARWDVGGIERPNDGDAVLRIICVKTELFMQFADGRLLRCLAVLHLPAREGELPPMRAALRAFDQEHLAVKRMRLQARPATPNRAAAECNRRNQECGNGRNARHPLYRRVEVNRLKAGETARRQVWLQWKGERGEVPRRVAR
jgi:hypothetical protein